MENIIKKYSKKYAIPHGLIRAIIKQESSENTYAIRYEPQYKWLYMPERIADKVGVPTQTEKSLQKHSFGLMQVMGAVAREKGYEKRYLTGLLKPEEGVKYGCKYLKWNYNRYNNWTDVISAYNQGTNAKDDEGNYYNQYYVDDVLKKWK